MPVDDGDDKEYDGDEECEDDEDENDDDYYDDDMTMIFANISLG